MEPFIKSPKWLMSIVVTFTLMSILGVNVTGYADITPVKDRTPEARDAIVKAVPNVSDAANVTAAHLAAITNLNLRNSGITALKTEDFSGMTGLTTLNLFNNELSSLPDSIFAGLTSLKTIRLGRNAVDPLPLTVSLEKIGTNQFKAVAPAGATFDIVLPVTVTNGSISGGATTLTIPHGSVESGTLMITRIPGTTAAVTADIGTLPSLPKNHYGYELTKSDVLPIAIISGSNTAPVFTDGTSVTRSVAERTAAAANIGTPIAATDAENDTLTYTLSGTDASAFDIDSTTGQLKTKATLEYETKTNYTVTLTVSDGRLTDTITVTINVTDVDEVVPVDPPTTPVPPTTNTAPSFYEGDSTIRVVPENTPATVNIGNPVLATDANNDPLTYTLGGVDAERFDMDSSGQLKTRAPLDYEVRRIYSVTITADDEELFETITVVIIVIDVHDTVLSARFVPVADRTPQVRDAIVAAVPNVTDAADVTKSQVAAITRLNLRNKGISKLKIGDFSGMTALTNLNLFGNRLHSLPAETFNGLTALSVLRLGRNAVDPLPLIVSLQQTSNNTFKAVITTGAPFHIDLPLTVTGGSISGGTTSVTIPQGAMESTSFTVIGTSAEVSIGTFPRLPRNHFGYELAQSTVCNRTQQVADAIAEAVGVDDCSLVTEIDLAMRTSLDLSDQSIKTLKVGDFDGMLSLRTLYLDDNDLTSLPSGIFKDLISLSELHLNSNNLTVIPQGLFEGLTQLRQLHLSANMVDPLPLIVSLQKVGTNQLKAVVPTGAPFTIVLPIRIKNGTLVREAATITIPTGKIESQLLTVTRSTGATDAVTVDIGTLPNLPSLHNGYALVKGIGGPLEVFPSLNSPPIFTDGATTTRTVAENTVANANIGTAIAATDINKDKLTYTLGGTDAAAFAVDSAMGQLKTKVSLDYETKSSYTVTLTVSDGKLNDTITVTINVSNVNEAPTFTDGNSVTREIAENTAAGENIGAVITATDPDDNTLTYSLGGTDASAFALGTTTGQLRTSAALDYETKSLYTLVLTASDGNLTDTIAVTINVTDVQERSEKQVDEVETSTNNAPIFTEGSTATRTVLEGTSSGVDIGVAVSATDADGHSLTYTLGDTDAAAFSIDSTSGQLRTSAALDYETKTSYTVTITVSDGNDGTDAITVTINVTDVDETPTNNVPKSNDLEETPTNNEPVSDKVNSGPVFDEGSSTTRAVSENTGSGVDIGAAVSATDPDDDTLTYSLRGTDATAFSINSTNGQIRTSAALDYETKSSYTVSVSASDGTLTDTISVTININDIDETVPNRAPVFTEGNTATRSIAENTTVGTNIGAAITATDADGNTLTYTLGGTDAAAFSIDSTSGQLRTSAALDYETKTSYTVTITVSDGNDGTDAITVTINVTDVDETPTNNVPKSNDLEETPTNNEPVSDKVNSGPVFDEGSSTTRAVSENTGSGVDIGAAVSATDPDDDTLTYSLRGTDATAFSINSTNGQIRTSAALDYETKSSYTVSVSASDGTLTDTISVTININDIDETVPNRAPVFTEGNTATRSIAENTTVGTNIGAAITATDADGNTLTYTLGGTDASAFRIVSTSGQLQTNTALDYETKNTYSVSVSVSDATLTDTINVTININDIDETVPNRAPVFTEGNTATRSIAENTTAGTNIGAAVAATDADGNTLTYRLGGTDAAAFSIVSTSGQLQTNAALNYDTKSSYSVTVSVSDGKGGTDSITVTIKIKEVIKPPLSQRTRQVRDAIVAAVSGVNNANNLTPAHLAKITSLSLSAKEITALKVNDFAGLPSLTHLYMVGNSISNISPLKDLTSLTHLYMSDNSISDISALKKLTSLTHLYLSDNSISDISVLEDLTSLTDLDLSENSINDVSVLEDLTSLRSLYVVENAISDYGPLQRLKAAIEIANNTISMDINNKPPEFTDGDSTTRSIAENTEAGTNIGDPISATNVGTVNTLTYSLGGTDAASFSINSTSGQLQTKAALDYEIKQSYTVTVSVSNGNNGSDSITVTINITDVNEPITPVNKRTQEVQDAIVAAVPGIDSADNVTAIHLAAITELDISGEYGEPNITSLQSGDFSGLTSLTDLNLFDNSISNISPLAGLTSLTWLSLGYNSVSDLSPLKNMTALTTLDLLDNSVTDISALKNMTALTWLRLRKNSIEDISALKKMTAMTTLELSKNSISDISALKNMTALTWLNLHSNSISDISALKDMTALTELNLYGNSISDISALKKMTALTELNLYDNSIGNISSLSGLTALTILNLGYNSVSDLSPLAGLTKLINLDLSNNSITDISKLAKLTLLTRLELNSNSITDISKLEDLTKLITLYLSSNSITDISELEHLTNLETLDLSSNSISDISALADLALINLGLSDNSITDISAIEGLITLWTLSLSENTISDYAPLRRLIVAIGAYNGTLDLDITIPEVPNNNDPVFTDGDSTTRSIAENTESDENIGDTVAATDADTGDTLTYHLGGTDAASFSIVRSSGQLQTNGALDYETQTSYTVTVAVSDGKGGSDSITVTINVTDVAGEAPSVETSSVIPENTALLTNYPNPFNPETWIPYQLAKPADVTLTIYDVRGHLVRTLRLGNQPAGIYRSRSKAAHWDGRNHFGEKVATGLYFYTLKAGDFSATRKMLIRK